MPPKATKAAAASGNVVAASAASSRSRSRDVGGSVASVALVSSSDAKTNAAGKAACIQQVLSWPLETRLELLPLLQQSVLTATSVVKLRDRTDRFCGGKFAESGLAALLQTAEMVDVKDGWL